MAKVALVLHIPDVKAADLRQIVHDLDELDSGGEYAINVENVGAEHILELILTGAYNPDYDIFLDKVEDCLKSPCGDV